MGNIVDDLAKNAMGAQMSSEIDPKLYKSRSPRANTARRKPKDHYLTAPRAKTTPSRRRTRSTATEDKHKRKKSKMHRDASSKPRGKRGGRGRQRNRKSSITSTVSENDIKHTNSVVEQLVSLGYGTEKEVIAASAISKNHRDIHEVLKKLTIIQSKRPIKFRPPPNTKKNRNHNPKKNHQKNNSNDSNISNNENLLKIIDWINSASPSPIQEPVEQKVNTEVSPPKQKAPEKVRSKSLSELSDKGVDDGHILLLPQQSPSFENDAKYEDEYGDENDDNFMYTLDLNETKESLETPKFDPLPGYKYKRPKIRLELRNSISATSMTTNLRKIEALKNEIRESIESTLSEVSAVIEEDTTNTNSNNSMTLGNNINISLSNKALYKVKEPPLLPAIPNHLLYWNDSNKNIEFIVCCTGHHMFNSEYKSGVYLYDIGSFHLQYLCKFPDKVYANSMGMAIDYESHKLHLFGGKGLFGQWLILNLKAKIWDIRKDLSKYKIPFALNMENVKCIVIENSLHIYSYGKFLRYNRRKHRFVELESFKNGTVKNVKYMFYVKKQKRIYIFGGDNNMNDEIYYCQHNESYHEYKWHKSEIKLPYAKDITENSYNAIIGFDHILFIFYYNRKQVCCIDLMKEKRYICTKTVNITNLAKSKLINTKTNMVHSLCMDHNGPTHNVIKLNDILLSTNIV